MRCAVAKIYLFSSELQMVSNRIANYEKSRIATKVEYWFSFSKQKLLYSTSRILNSNQDSIESKSKLHSKFDHKLWWKVNGNIVRHLLEGDIEWNDFDRDGFRRSSLEASLQNRFNKVYATDAIYQDLFIDCPPCRDALELSFKLIDRFWEVKIIEWGPPTLITLFPHYSRENINDESHHFERNKRLEATEERTNCSINFFLRIPYKVAQRSRLSFLPSFLSMNYPSNSVLMEKISKFEYEGWIDLYIRPVAPSAIWSEGSHIDVNDENDDCIRKWEVYRHDDRIRINFPQCLSLNRRSEIDALTIIEKIPVVSTIFRYFRRAHGLVVGHVAKIKVLYERRE